MTIQKDIIDELYKELFAEFIKQGLRATYPPPIAEVYCKQIDDTKHMAKLVEKMLK